MALIICPKCGKQFSDRAEKCPQCGTSKEEIQLLIKEKEAEKRLRAERWQNNKKWVIVGIALCLLAFSSYMIYANKGTFVASDGYEVEEQFKPLRVRRTIHVIIPDGATKIEEAAFMCCSQSGRGWRLISVEIPNSVTSIENLAFADCSDLTYITIPNSVISIGERAFAGCFSLGIEIPNSVTSIGENAFEDCSLLNIKIPARFKGKINLEDEWNSVTYY